MKTLFELTRGEDRQLYFDLWELWINRQSVEAVRPAMRDRMNHYDRLYGAGAARRALGLDPEVPTPSIEVEKMVNELLRKLPPHKPQRLSENNRIVFSVLAQIILGYEAAQ
jgi:hypothetical protein